MRKKGTAEEIYHFLSPHLQAELEPEPDQVSVPDPEPGPDPDQEPRPDPDPEPEPDPDPEPGPHPDQEPGKEKSTLCKLCGLLFHTQKKMDIHMKRHSNRKKTPLR